MLAVAGYILYKGMNPSVTVPPAVISTGPVPPTGTTPVATPTAPSADSAKASLVAALQAANAPQSGGDYSLTPWQFNYYLAQATGVNLATVSGDIGKVFPGCGTGAAGGCDNTPISLTAFWSTAAPWLQKNGNLSGIGRFPVQTAGVRMRIPITMSNGWR